MLFSDQMAVAMNDYAAQSEGELPFKEGDLFVVMEKNNEPGWWRVRRGSEEGLVPESHMQVKS